MSFFSITRYPMILKIFWVLLESTGSGRVSGTRQTVRSIFIRRRQKLLLLLLCICSTYLQTMMEDDFGGHSVHCEQILQHSHPPFSPLHWSAVTLRVGINPPEVACNVLFTPNTSTNIKDTSRIGRRCLIIIAAVFSQDLNLQ